MWITEPFTVQLNNGNAKKRLDLYGDMTFDIAIDAKFETASRAINLKVVYDGTKAFETMVAEQLKAEVPELKDYKTNELKSWFKSQDKTADYIHRHYIEDNEYIPFDRTQKDKVAYINSFLAKEIDYEIISWEEFEQLGYEILPNKYFYKYEEPTPSDELIKEFWKLEEDAVSLLNEIREM